MGLPCSPCVVPSASGDWCIDTSLHYYDKSLQEAMLILFYISTDIGRRALTEKLSEILRLFVSFVIFFLYIEKTIKCNLLL
jgi:hypothetical protein